MSIAMWGGGEGGRKREDGAEKHTIRERERERTRTRKLYFPRIVVQVYLDLSNN